MSISTTILYAILNHFILLPVVGFAIGILTKRLSSRDVFPSLISARTWNTLVNLMVARFIWTHLLLLRPRDGVGVGDGGMICNLPYYSSFYYNKTIISDELHDCSFTEGVQLVIILILKSLIMYISVRLGAALQPVGLTGGIACGKSTVSDIFRSTSSTSSKGTSSSSIKKDSFAVVDVDGIAHDILVPGKMKIDCAYQRVVSAFSEDDILEENNNSNYQSKQSNTPKGIDRRKLGDVIFRDATKRRKLNGITHPLISKIMMKQIIQEDFFPSSNDTAIVSVDIPLLYELGLKMLMLFGIKVVIACSSDLQLKRLMSRNPDLTIEQCVKRIESQIPIYKKAEMADIVIWNNGTMDDLVLEVEKARNEIMSRSYGYLGITLARLVAISGLISVLVCLGDVSRIR
mmetsp:Transcript_405/g.575  ORF Transcript_405/g.575 Transcript_405/m.575 type:complete len:403 (-) Transcript_405:139-1347(-)